MMFVLRMAVRETRASWRRLLFFFVCIAVGVAAIVALRSVIQSVRAVFGTEARSLIAADVLISTNRDWTPEARETIDRRLAGAGAIAADRNHRDADDGAAGGREPCRGADGRNCARSSRLSALRHARTRRRPTYSHALLKNQGVLVRPELLTALGVKVGDQIVIGQAPFTIRGVIKNEPGRRVGDFSLGPARAHRLRRPAGDRAAVVRQPRPPRAARRACPTPQIEPLVTTLRDDFKDEFVSARSFRAHRR